MKIQIKVSSWFADTNNQAAITNYEYVVERAAVASGYSDVPDLSEEEMTEIINIVDQVLESMGVTTITDENRSAVEAAVEERLQ